MTSLISVDDEVSVQAEMIYRLFLHDNGAPWPDNIDIHVLWGAMGHLEDIVDLCNAVNKLNALVAPELREHIQTERIFTEMSRYAGAARDLVASMKKVVPDAVKGGAT